MSKTIDLNPNRLKPTRKTDERLVSYNIEMTEVTGGAFWKAYTPRPDRRGGGIPGGARR